MRLFRKIAGAQEGQVFVYMGDAFGISDELAAQVVRYFLPPIIKAIGRRTETSKGLLSFLEFLGKGHHERYLSDPGMFTNPKAQAEGYSVLQILFPQPAHQRKIISNRAQVLPVPPQMLEDMFPYIALLALGAIEEKARLPLEQILQRLTTDRPEQQLEGNLYKALAGEIRRRRMTSKALEKSKLAGLSGMLNALFSGSDARRAA